MTYSICGVEKTEELGKMLAKYLEERKIKSAFIAMYGEMGVGKTAFVRGFASYFGIIGVKSPTYTVVNEYRSGSTRIFHFDLYRIEGEDDLLSIGFDDYVMSDGFSICEWSEKIPDDIPTDAITVKIERCPESPEMRKIEISCL